MGKFIKMLIIFLVPIVIVCITAEVILRAVPNDYLFKKNYLDEHAAELEALFLGSSHAYFGIDVTAVSMKAFNAAMTSQSIDYDLKILKKYEDELVNLKYIVLPISYFSLFSSLDDERDQYLKNYAIYYGVDVPAGLGNNSELFGQKGFSLVAKLKAGYLSNESPIHCDEFGSYLVSEVADENKLLETAKNAVERHTKDINKLIRGMQVLDSIIEHAEAKEISVILYTPPAHNYYVNCLDDLQLWSTIDAAESQTLNHKDVYYFNFLMDGQFGADDFSDADHLNSKGALKLTKLLYEKILVIEDMKSI